MVIQNKRGQDLSIGTLILIVLGIVVLVLLILGFTLGWDNLWEKVNIFGGGSSISTVVNACKLAITSEDSYTFCEKKWKVTLESGKKDTVGCRDPVLTGIDKNSFNQCADFEPYSKTCEQLGGVLTQSPNGNTANNICMAKGALEPPTGITLKEEAGKVCCNK